MEDYVKAILKQFLIRSTFILYFQTMTMYWPDYGSVSFHGPLAVQFDSETEISHGIFFRTFKLSNKEKPVILFPIVIIYT